MSSEVRLSEREPPRGALASPKRAHGHRFPTATVGQTSLLGGAVEGEGRRVHSQVGYKAFLLHGDAVGIDLLADSVSSAMNDNQ